MNGSGNHKMVLTVLVGMTLGNLFVGNWIVFFILSGVTLYVGRREVKRLIDRGE